MKVDESAGAAASAPFFQRAVEIDAQFAMAWANLGLDYSEVGESVLSAENATKAWQLRDRASDPERFFIDFLYDRQVMGNLGKAYQTLELWHQTYPRGDKPPSPQQLLGAFRMGQADLKEQLRQLKRNSRPIPAFAMLITSLRPAIFSRPLPRSRECSSACLRT
jgi:hypothetical protein